MDYPVREELAQMLLFEWDDEIQTLHSGDSESRYFKRQCGRPPRMPIVNVWWEPFARYELSPGTAWRNCCRVHSAVGCGVTLQCRIRRLPISMISNTYRIWKRAVIAMRKSQATIA